MRKGLFLSFEGAEACGKSTQINLLAEWLRGQGRVVETTREPGGTEAGERIRHLLKHDRAGENLTREAEMLLFAASRAQLVREKIRPWLAEGRVVLADRFHDSTTVYQGMARGIEAGTVAELVRIATGGTRPERTFLLDVEPEVAAERLRLRRPEAEWDRFDSESRAFHETVRKGYLDLAGREPGRVRVVDGGRTAEAVFGEIRREVEALLAEEERAGES